MARLFAILGALFTMSLLVNQPVQAAEPTIDQLLDATDDVARGTTSHATITMQVKTARYERTMRLESWSEGKEKSLIRILAPQKDAGISTLMRDKNIWNYLPKVDRTMKVPGAMMSGRWMGSHFTNDDLVKSNRLSEDFDGAITARPGGSAGDLYTVRLTPKPDAAIVWGHIIVRVGVDLIPIDITYFDEDGTLMRTLVYGDVKMLGGKRIPSTMTLRPANKDGEFTRIVYDTLALDVALPERTFSLQSLKR
jgi:outer membrane lipoprotein-sorting protein